MSKNIIIGIIVMMNVGLIYLLKQKNKVHEIQQTMLVKNMQNAQSANQSDSFIATKYWWEMNSEGDVVNDVNLVSDLSEDGKTYLFSELIGDQPKLVLRYSELHCDVCVDSTLTRLKQFTDEIGKENVLLITSYANPRDMYAFKRLNQIDLPMYNLGDQSLGIAAERSETPYLFMVYPNRKVERVYLFYKEIADQITTYFGILRDKYFNV